MKPVLAEVIDSRRYTKESEQYVMKPVSTLGANDSRRYTKESEQYVMKPVSTLGVNDSRRNTT